MNISTKLEIRGGLRLMRPLVIAVLASMLVSDSHGADIFLKLVGAADGAAVKGEGRDEQYPGSEGWFALNSFSLGIENTVTLGSASGGAGAGKAAFMDLELEKPLDSASPTMFQALASGKRFDSAQLVVRRGGGTEVPEAYLVYEFKVVYLSSQKWSGSDGDDVPGESVRMIYGALKITYKPSDPKTGKPGSPIEGKWNGIENNDSF